MLHVDIYGLVTATTFDDGLQEYLDLKFPRLGIATVQPQMRTDSEGDLRRHIAGRGLRRQ